MTSNGESNTESILPESVRGSRPIEVLRNRYPVGVLAIVFVYMLAIRLQRYGRFVTENGVYFSGNDPWYHYRAVKYTVLNWPSTMPFDPMTGYPEGADPGQFGTLFDQIIATVALIVGFGSPSDQTIRIVMVLAPPVFGALCIIPVYYIGRHLHSRSAGLIGAVALALTPGVFLNRSLVGVTDHNVAEPLFMGLAVFALLFAFKRATDDVIVLELLQERDMEVLWSSFGPSILAGVSIALYMFVWPPGMLLVGITAIFYTAYVVFGSVTSRQIESVLLVGVISNLVLGFLLLINYDTFEISTAEISLVQIGLAFATAAWCGLLIGVSRTVDERDMPWYSVSGITLLTSTLGLGLLVVLTPDIAQYIWHNILRVIGFGQHANTLTIGEGQPFVGDSGFFPTVFTSYGMLFFTALLGFCIIAFTMILNLRDSDTGIASHLFVLIWAVFMASAAFTQVRFNYYLAPVVAILVGYTVMRLFDWIDIPDAFPRLEPYQYITLVLVLALVFVPILVYPFGSSSVVRAQSHGVGEYQAWEEPLDWMNNNTPGYESLETYGTYEEPSNGDFPYEDDVYGVMSWWDYGHYISTTAERVPVANPFQQNAPEAAQFLLASNETEAQSVLDEMGAENVKYVAVDWKMVSPTSKFGAPVVWHPDLSQTDMFENVYVQGEDNSIRRGMTTLKQRYYESLMVRLYQYHGSAKAPGDVVVDYENTTVETRDGRQVQIKIGQQRTQDRQSGAIKRFNSSREAAQFVQNDNSSHYGGFGLQPREKVDALNHYRLVKSSQANAFSSRSYQASLQQYSRFGRIEFRDFTRNAGWTKLFERVPGATVQGDGGPANSTVVAQVQMKDPTQNSTFVYRQFAQTDGNGEFQMTLPYSTTNYDEYGPETGHTNVSVRAESSYEFVSIKRQITVDENNNQTLEQQQWYTTTEVPEGAVNGATNETIDVTLEEVDQIAGNRTAE